MAPVADDKNDLGLGHMAASKHPVHSKAFVPPTPAHESEEEEAAENPEQDQEKKPEEVEEPPKKFVLEPGKPIFNAGLNKRAQLRKVVADLVEKELRNEGLDE